MTNCSNEELAELYHQGERAEEALAQLITNLTPMMIKIGKEHLSACGLFDTDDYIQEGSIVLWNLLEKRTFREKSGKFSNLFYVSFRNRCIKMYWNYAGKNFFPVGESPDYYNYGYHVCRLIIDPRVEEHREKERQRTARWYEKKTGKKRRKRQPVSEEEMLRRKEAARERQKAYYLAHREKYKGSKKKWYQEHREYALLYQKAYDFGIRIGTMGPPGKSK